MIASRHLSEFKERVKLLKGDFRNLDILLEELGVDKFDGILFDVGLSSYQLESYERGFSFNIDSPLDMRMDTSRGIKASELLNKLTQREIEGILREFGEEPYARRIAEGIVSIRKKEPIGTTGKLIEIIKRAIMGRRRLGRIHPATRTFQALRIAVNDELGALREGLPKGINFLTTQGVICAISFHSLEDRIVKECFRSANRAGMTTVLTKKPILPSREEVIANPRARSAKLRAARRK